MVGRFESNRRGLDALVKGMKERGSNVININFKWNHVEPRTGVFQFQELDRYVDYFTRRGIRFGLIIGGSLFDGSPYDCWGEWMMDHNGDCQVWRNFCVTSPASPKYRTAIRGLIAALYKRYNDNPCFHSWTYSGQGLDSGTYMDHYDRITDYSPYFQTRFRAFLKSRYGTVQKLNRKWNTNFSDFEKVTPPMPDFSRTVDLSPPWRDFTEAKLEVFADANTNLFDPAIRALDSKRPISNYLTYMGPVEYLFPAMKQRGSSINDGGGESHQMVRLYSIAANYGIRRQPESHFTSRRINAGSFRILSRTLFGTAWNTAIWEPSGTVWSTSTPTAIRKTKIFRIPCASGKPSFPFCKGCREPGRTRRQSDFSSRGTIFFSAPGPGDGMPCRATICRKPPESSPSETFPG